jgi:hypothetical protein
LRWVVQEIEKGSQPVSSPPRILLENCLTKLGLIQQNSLWVAVKQNSVGS